MKANKTLTTRSDTPKKNKRFNKLFKWIIIPLKTNK